MTSCPLKLLPLDLLSHVMLFLHLDDASNFISSARVAKTFYPSLSELVVGYVPSDPGLVLEPNELFANSKLESLHGIKFNDISRDKIMTKENMASRILHPKWQSNNDLLTLVEYLTFHGRYVEYIAMNSTDGWVSLPSMRYQVPNVKGMYIESYNGHIRIQDIEIFKSLPIDRLEINQSMNRSLKLSVIMEIFPLLQSIHIPYIAIDEKAMISIDCSRIVSITLSNFESVQFFPNLKYLIISLPSKHAPKPSNLDTNSSISALAIDALRNLTHLQCPFNEAIGANCFNVTSLYLYEITTPGAMDTIVTTCEKLQKLRFVYKPKLDGHLHEDDERMMSAIGKKLRNIRSLEMRADFSNIDSEPSDLLYHLLCEGHDKLTRVSIVYIPANNIATQEEVAMDIEENFQIPVILSMKSISCNRFSSSTYAVLRKCPNLQTLSAKSNSSSYDLNIKSLYECCPHLSELKYEGKDALNVFQYSHTHLKKICCAGWDDKHQLLMSTKSQFPSLKAICLYNDRAYFFVDKIQKVAEFNIDRLELPKTGAYDYYSNIGSMDFIPKTIACRKEGYKDSYTTPNFTILGVFDDPSYRSYY